MVDVGHLLWQLERKREEGKVVVVDRPNYRKKKIQWWLTSPTFWKEENRGRLLKNLPFLHVWRIWEKGDRKGVMSAAVKGYHIVQRGAKTERYMEMKHMQRQRKGLTPAAYEKRSKL
ncbi:unnamed protein product [Linum trigynum]|uniref:Uncharacterized protein n=1 Tax=Linum trigynum TaxID=586398 RepID=A0AAV2EZS1_9ROSI